jgi:anti-sigma regulatory factor (Ser/Thr protein kinase)
VAGPDLHAGGFAVDVSTALPFDASAPRVARQFVAQATQSLPGDVRSDATLLASELVTNGVRYGRPDLGIRIQIDQERVHVEVHDGGEPMPPWVAPGASTTHPRGRGLVIVDHLATAWGVGGGGVPTGKAVWFELRLAKHGADR